jgi:hypothetical protein
MLQPMKSLKLMFLNFFSLVILSELTIKCVIRFGKFMRIFRNQRKWYKEVIIIFNVQWNRVVLCRSEECFFFTSMGLF